VDWGHSNPGTGPTSGFVHSPCSSAYVGSPLQDAGRWFETTSAHQVRRTLRALRDEVHDEWERLGWRREGEPTVDESEDRRYLVLLIGSLAGPGPATEFLRLSQQQPSFFHVVVPATVPQYGWTWAEGQALADAQERIQIMTEFGSAMGLNIRAEVLPTDDAVEAVRRVAGNESKPFDELIVVDRAKGIRRWVGDRVIDELRRDPGLPITRFEADPPLQQGKDFDVAELRSLFQEFLNRTDTGRYDKSDGTER
jgi:hypothetical protein